MQTTTKIAATGGAALAACAACCAVSIVPAVVAGAGFAAVGGTVVTWGVPALLLVIPVGIYLMTRKSWASRGVPATSTADAPLSGCGCGASCGSMKEQPPIACTLDAGDFEERTASIRDLALRSLHKSSRGRLTLSLVYALDASDEVAELVAKERACCAFLDQGRRCPSRHHRTRERRQGGGHALRSLRA